MGILTLKTIIYQIVELERLQDLFSLQEIKLQKNGELDIVFSEMN